MKCTTNSLFIQTTVNYHFYCTIFTAAWCFKCIMGFL